MALNPGQRAVAWDSHRFRVVVAGRRWGKTTLAIRELARFAREPARTCWYIAPSYRMARQIVWDRLKYRLYDLRWIADKNESDLSLTLRNGSRICLRGADNPDSLRGVSLDFVIFDEAAMIDHRAWTEVIRPTLSDRRGHGMFIGTPMGRNWFYDLYQSASQRDTPNWSAWTYTTAEGGNVSAEEIQQAQADMDIRQYRQEYLASFETYEGQIYYNFDRAESVQQQAASANTIIVGMDFNVSPMTAVIMHRTNLGLHVESEIVIYNSNTQEMVEEIQRRYANYTVMVFPDPAGVQRKTSAGGRTDIMILQQAGFQVKYRTAHPSVRDRINSVNALLLNAQGQRRLTVDPGCRRLIEALEKHTYREDTLIPNKDQGYDHITDALGYAVEFLFPITRNTQDMPAEPQRWGVQTVTYR